MKLKVLFSLSLLWSSLILAIGTWWSYLLLKSEEGTKLARMIKWEGATFLILLLLVSGSIFLLFLKNLKKTKSLQAFFSSMTHELKTPLASIRLQADALDSKLITPELRALTERLIEDTQNLEIKMDKILALTRVEGDGILTLEGIDLIGFLQASFKRYGKNLTLKISQKEKIFVLADEFALALIFKNLLENTKKHAQSQTVEVFLKEDFQNVTLIYNDRGLFSGDQKKLGSLFYKFNSGAGTGIGLYLCKRLMRKMRGNLDFNFSPNLSFNLTFEKARDLV